MNILSNLLSQPAQPPRQKKQRRIEIKSPREIEIMRQSAIVATVLKEFLSWYNQNDDC